jgi:hypothetical protein
MKVGAAQNLGRRIVRLALEQHTDLPLCGYRVFHPKGDALHRIAEARSALIK